MKLEVGSTIVAKDPCKMEDGGEETLTVGKEYKITQLNHNWLTINDDDGDDHDFELTEFDIYFNHPTG